MERLNNGARSFPVHGETEVARFKSHLKSATISPGGDMSLTIAVPSTEIPKTYDLLAMTGGIMFEMVVIRKPREQMEDKGED